MSKVQLTQISEHNLDVDFEVREVRPMEATKCERCWHYRDDVGANPAHPTICGRCDSNLYGEGEVRTKA